MIKYLVSIVFLFQLISTNITQTSSQIEIFDVNKGNVMMHIEARQDLQEITKTFIDEIAGVYTGVTPIPNNGLMIKVPLFPAVTVNNQWFNDIVDEVIIIMPNQEQPYLLVFDNENKSHFLTFDGDIDTLIKKLPIK